MGGAMITACHYIISIALHAAIPIEWDTSSTLIAKWICMDLYVINIVPSVCFKFS